MAQDWNDRLKAPVSEGEELEPWLFQYLTVSVWSRATFSMLELLPKSQDYWKD
jgi:hypothetical protein